MGTNANFFLLSLVRVISKKGVKNQSLSRQPGGAMQKVDIRVLDGEGTTDIF
jgi:hypothetical protein